MSSARFISAIFAVALHGSVGYALTQHNDSFVRLDALESGAGNDLLTVEQGIAIEGIAKGDAAETIETAEVQAVEAAEPPPPVQEIKPDQLREAITAKDSKFEDNIVKAEEPPPPVEPPPPKPQVVQAAEPQPAQVAMVSEQSSAEQKVASSATARSEYLGALRDVLEKSKINPRSRVAGTVVIKFKVGLGGELLSREVSTSSGSKILDEAAVAALDRAAPFPPMPHDAANEPLVVSVPFKFVTR